MEKRTIKPLEKYNKELALPGSKSISNRVLLMAALARGTSSITNLARCDDTRFLLRVLQLLGIKSTEDIPGVFHLTGTGGVFTAHTPPLFVGNAGTCMRFLTSFLAIGTHSYILEGSARMHERPIRDLADGLKRLGVDIEYLGKPGYPPLKINANGFPGGEIEITGSLSSQYITSLLLCAPYGKKDFTVTITGKKTSKPYLDMTTELMHTFGINVHKTADTYIIQTPQEYIPLTIDVEGDASSASYFFAAAAVTGSRIKITNIPLHSLQGDSRFPDILAQMGCKVTRDTAGITLEGTGTLHGIAVDLNDMPDTVQTLAVVALFAKGTTTIRNVGNLRIKETDRIAALARELRKFGAKVKEYDDGIAITPGEKVTSAEIETYNDHRMAMSFTVAGLRVPGITIKNPDVVYKSFPAFFDFIEQLYR